jgi:ABC-type glycerol-3-phosphate transport system substrate-binding protein
MSSARSRLAALVAALALGAVACGGGSGTGSEVEVAEGGDRDFVATTIGGDDLALADYAGQDVMVWFWAPW